jgi:hypothetical protein
MSKFNISCAVAALAISASLSTSAQANVVWNQGFETDTAGWLDINSTPSPWYGTITRVASGTGGVTSATGGYHAVATGDASSAPFSRFDGYRSTFGQGYTASIDIYLSLDWSAGEGFDYSVASSNQSGGHLRDFVFHVTQDTSTGSLLIGGTNNSNAAPREDLETLPGYATITAAGWYTFEHVFRNAGDGSLAVDLIVTDSSDNLVYQTTRNNSADLLATVVGGNRYAWFTDISVADALNIDNHSLNLVPEPATLGLLGLAGLALGRRRR